MNDMRIYVASLSDYNNGRLEGKWLDLSDYSDASELMEAIQEMLDELTEKYKSVDGEVREEFAVHDYEGIPSTLASEYMSEQDFQQLYDIAEVADDRGVPVEVLIERAGDTGSDDYQALADSLIMVVDGNDESDIVAEYEDQIGELGYDWWSNHVGITKTDQRLLYGEDVDNFKEEILAENPDMDESEAESQAEEKADAEEEARNSDLIGYLQERGYEDEFPNWVYKDYESAWKNDLSYEFDVINHDGEMYVFSNNYSLGGTILSGMIGAYIGYKVGRAKPQKKGFETEKRIGRKIKGALTKKKMARGGSTSKSDLDILIDEINEKSGGRFYIGGAYGNYELWGKDKDGGDHRIEVGSRKDIREALIKNRYNSKFTEYAKGGGVSYNKVWEVIGINLYGKMFKERITLGRMSDKEDVKNALRRRTDLNIREVTSIKEVFAEGGSVDEDIQFAVVIKKDDKNYNKIGYSKLTEFITDKQGNEFDKLYFEGKKLPTKYNAEDLNYSVRELDTFTSSTGDRKFILLKELTDDNRIYYYILHYDDKKVYAESYDMNFIKSELKRLTNGKNFYSKAGVNFGEGGEVEDFSEFDFQVGDKLDLGSKGIKYFKQYDGEKIIVVDSKSDLKTSKGTSTYPSSVKKVLNRKYAKGGGVDGISEEDARKELERLKSEGKITLSIGNHGLIFMQIVKTGNAMVSSFKKSYESYTDALEHYYRVSNRFAKGGGVSEFWLEINESTLYERLPYDLGVVNEDEDLISGNIWIKFRKSPMEMPSYELKRAISEDFEYFGYGNQEPPKRVSLMDGSWGSFYIHVENLTLNEIMTLLLELPEQVQERLEERKIKGYKDLGLDTYGQSLDLTISQSSDEDDYEYAKGGGVDSERTYSLYELYYGQPYNFYNEEQDKFIWDEPTKATLFTKAEAENKRKELRKPRSDYYQRTGNISNEIHIGDLYEKGILKYAQGGGISGLDDLLRG